MLTTIDEILKKEGVDRSDTIYKDDPAAVRRFLLSAGDFFEVRGAGREAPDRETTARLSGGAAAPAPAGRAGQTEAILVRVEEIGRQLKRLKTEEEDRIHAHAGEIRFLREEKRRLMRGLAGAEQNDENREGGRGNGPDRDRGTGRIRFKNSLDAMSLAGIRQNLPALGSVCFRDAWSMPFFVKNLDLLQRASESGEELAVTGGPCLFGVHEVLARVTWQDGSVTEYDFSSGRHFMEDGRQRDLGEDLMRQGGEVREISFRNQKKGVTSQEYDSIHCLFECAQALHARLTIPLPDMSYIKYLQAITQGLPEAAAREAGERFRAEAYGISDLYRELIGQMKRRYPAVRTEVVHERDERLCRLFSEKRQPFLREASLRRLTEVPGKAEPVLDYITMPALPFYIWGIRHILQVDSLDEADSYRKCVKLHKKALCLGAMLYPERVSGDGENTIFYAPLPFKEYREEKRGGKICEDSGSLP